MTHAEMDELYELYALGALETEQATEIDAHLQDGCAYCLEHVRDAAATAAALSELAGRTAPPKSLRHRVTAIAKPSQSSRWWKFSVVALCAATIALLIFAILSAGDASRLHQDLDRVTSERDQLRAAVQILSESQTRTVEFGRAANVPHGRVLVNPAGGLVVVGRQLPEIPNDKTFELWLIPKEGAPEPAGLFRSSSAGEFVHVSSQPVNLAKTEAIAISVEPRQGSAAPTTKPILIVPLA